MIKDCQINYQWISGGVGFVAGENSGTILECSVLNSKITFYEFNVTNDVGGIVGRMNGGTLNSCLVKNCEISGYGGDDSSNVNYGVGGIAGGLHGGTISNCYATDNTINGNYYVWPDEEEPMEWYICYAGQLVGLLETGTIKNSFSYNTTTTSLGGDFVGLKEGGSITNNYQDKNSGDATATYKTAEWFASSKAAESLGDAFEYVEGQIHPTLKWEQVQPTGNKLRIQTGFDGTTNSYLELDLGFDLGTITVDLSSATAAANSITAIDNYLTLLNDKQSIIGKDYNRLESAAQSNTLEIENMAGAKSIIVDADTAKENSEYIKTQILQNAATSLLAQTVNINSQIVLGLLTSL